MASRLALQPRRSAACGALAMVASMLLFAAPASAKTHTFKVKSTKDAVHGSCSSKCSLRDAVIAADKAGGKSTIIVPAGHYKLTIDATSSGDPTDNPAAGDLDINAGAQVTIKGAGPTKTILDANLIDRMFAVHQHAALTVSGVTVENGDQSGTNAGDDSIESEDGGAFYNNGTLSITNCTLKDNSSFDDGGVIYSDGDAVATSVTDSTVTRNNDDDPGGVLYAIHGKITFTGDTIEHNLAANGGGAIFADVAGSITVSHTKLEYNTAGDNGGALYVLGASKLSISHSSFAHNDASGPGGAASIVSAGAVSISHSTFTQNVSYGNGGAIQLDLAGPASVTDSKFSDNAAHDDDDGGAIYDASGARLTVAASSFTNNTAEGGGAIATSGANLTLTRTHLTANTAGDGGAISLSGTTPTAVQSISASVFTADRSTTDTGGGIQDISGDLELTASTFYEDSAGGDGGALYYDGNGGMALVNDTFDSNSAGFGGALFLRLPASVGDAVLRNDTIAHNTAYVGGGIDQPYNANTIVNTIVADNVAELTAGAPTGSGDCNFVFDYNSSMGTYTGTADHGHNLDSDHTCLAKPGGHPAAGDKTANPKLGPLRNNGGPVPTDALLKGSPAIGAADKAQCPKTDARGDKRGGKCDIGAYQTEPNKKHKKR